MNNEKNPADELWEHRNDPDEWSEEAEEVETRPSGSAVVSFRISWDELEELDEAASAKGESLSEFIRKAVRSRLEEIAISTFVEMTYGGAREVRLHTDTPARLRGTRASFVPEEPLDPDREMAGMTS
jgi:uncharacterized protein (DUF1778 family)